MEDSIKGIINKLENIKINPNCNECKSITKKCFCNKLNYYNKNIKSILKVQLICRDYLHKNSIYSNDLTEKEKAKLIEGKEARGNWSNRIKNEDYKVIIHDYNKECEGVFTEVANIKLDLSTKQRPTLGTVVLNKNLWSKKVECIYILTLNDYIMKIGGSRKSMKERWNSYLTGRCVIERKKMNGENFPGKMSVTNAYSYHTIENSLINNKYNKWKIYVWELPITTFTVNILNEKINVIAQTFNSYETICMKKYAMIAESLPLLSKNCDPTYK